MVLVSTVSWTVDKHICMGRVMDISLFAHADTCGMDTDTETSCCDDESFTVQGQDDLKMSFDSFGLDHQVFLVAFAQSYLDLFVPLEEIPVPHEEYPPPILVKDIHILDQVFLI